MISRLRHLIMQEKDVYKVAVFISPHGFGHAARAAAVMEALYHQSPGCSFHIFTRVPKWFFSDSLTAPFDYHEFLTDIGLAQKNPLEEDIASTIELLEKFLPFREEIIQDAARIAQRNRCRMVLCDISPMGIAVARRLGIPSLLIENFTWDWIYEEYLNDDIRIQPYIRYLHDIFIAADYHVQTEPVSYRRTCDLTTPPVSRVPRRSRSDTRNALGISENDRAILITMGGIQSEYSFLDRLKKRNDILFVIPGAADEACRQENLILLPHHTPLFHPDLVNASDVIISKLGYSTLAEVYAAGVPFGFLMRKRFREAPPLRRFIDSHMLGIEITEDDFTNGNWLEHIDSLLALPRRKKPVVNGADYCAAFIRQILEYQK